MISSNLLYAMIISKKDINGFLKKKYGAKRVNYNVDLFIEYSIERKVTELKCNEVLENINFLIENLRVSKDGELFLLPKGVI